MRPRDELATARLLLDTLSLGDSVDTGQLRARWALAPHGALVTLAKYEGAELWLAQRLRALGITLAEAPAAALDAAATRTRARTMRADAALVAVLEAFRAAQVDCILLKSAALRRLTARLPMAGARATSDVDLLVPEADGDHALGVLRARGWSLLDAPHGAGSDDPAVAAPRAPIAPSNERGTMRAERMGAPHHHLPSVADASGVAIELHTTTGHAVRPMEAWRRAVADRQPANLDGVVAWAPGDSWLLLHAVAHGLGDAGERARSGLRLRYWLDGAILIAGNTLRWDVIRERVGTGETGPPALARAWLWTAAGIAGCRVGIDELGSGEVAAFELDRLLAWRLRVLERHDATSRWGRKLLEEGARIEAGLPPELAWSPEPLRARVRRRAAQWLARAHWAWWRAQT